LSIQSFREVKEVVIKPLIIGISEYYFYIYRILILVYYPLKDKNIINCSVILDLIKRI
jgi:hypothetical protein